MTWTDENGLKYSFNDDNYTATVDLSQYKGQDNFLIPKNVKYSSKEYAIVKLTNSSRKKIKCIDFSDDSLVSSFSYIYTEKLFIPPLVERIEQDSIYNSNVLQSIEFKKNSKIQYINMMAFKNSQITKITFPSSVTEIYGENCWSDGTYLPKLTEIEFEPYSKLKKIGPYSFQNTSIKQITILPSVKEICDNAFSDCKLLDSVDFPINSELIYIGYEAFKNTNIKEITIPSSVKEICDNAFSDCKLLDSINFPINSELRYIDYEAFKNTNIKKITIPSSVKEIYDSAFSDCKLLDSINFPNNSELRFIGYEAFKNTNIKNIKIPAQVEKLDEGFFFGASQLNTIDVSESNSHYSIMDGLLVYHKEQILFANKNISIIKIPQSIKEISINSFENCKNLNELIIPENSVLEIIKKYVPPNCELFLIENNAFQSSGIEKIDITSHIIQIGSNVFDDCKQLTSISFLNSNLKSIGNCSFQSSSLTEIVVPSSVKQIGESSFNKCDKLKIIKFSKDSNLRYIEQYTFNSVNQLEEILIPPKVREIGKNAFENCTKLKKVEFLANSELTLIDDCAFKNASSLDTIIIGSRIKRIGMSAFESAQLNTIQFKDSQNSELKLIDKYAFKNCKFTQILIPPSVQIIEDNAFDNCYNLKSINFDENSQLKTLGNSLFESTKIESIIIPSQVDDIRDKCFKNANNLKSIIPEKENEHYSFLSEGMLLYKENKKSSFFDTLIYVNPSLKNVKIPSYVKHISMNAFLNNCWKCIECIEFSKGCEVDFIHRNSINFNCTKTIIAPLSLINEPSFFGNYANIKQIGIIDEGDVTIDEFTFAGFKNISCISFPYAETVRIEKGCKKMSIIVLKNANVIGDELNIHEIRKVHGKLLEKDRFPSKEVEMEFLYENLKI